MNNNQLTLMNEAFGAVRLAEREGEYWFCGSDVAKALGYKRPSEAIRQHCREKGTVKHDTLTNGGVQSLLFINEGNVYRLIAKSKLEKAEQFEEWVFDEVLPSIRQNGAYISENITEEQENLLDKFGSPRKLAKTILEARTMEMQQLLDDYLAYKKPRNAKDKLRYINHVSKAIDEKIALLEEQRLVGESYDLQIIARQIQEEKTKVHNRKNGGQKAALRKELNLLEEIMELQNELSAAISNLKMKDIDNLNWNKINYHPFTVNYMYKRTGNKIYKSNEYESWIRKFPYKELPIELGIDLTKPFELCIYYEAKPGFDVDNCLKSFIDYLQRYYGFNDNIIEAVYAKRVGTVKDFKEGTISFAVKQTNASLKRVA